MSKVNFDSLKNIKAPQAWVDQAATIPETASKRRHAFPLYRTAAAASLVLVSVVGLLIFLFFGSKAPIAIKEKGSGEVEATEANGSVRISDDGLYPSLDPVFPTVPQVVPTDTDGNPVIEAMIEPTTAKGNKEPSATEPTEKARPTQETVDADDHAQKPTLAVTPSNPPAPTELPAPDPTQAPTEGYRPPGDTEFYGMFTLGDPGVVSGGNYAVEDTTIFCRIYDSSGSLIGNSPLYSPQREAAIISRFDDGTVVAYYNPTEKGLFLTEDVYEYVFYDIHGNELFRDVKFVF